MTKKKKATKKKAAAKKAPKIQEKLDAGEVSTGKPDPAVPGSDSSLTDNDSFSDEDNGSDNGTETEKTDTETDTETETKELLDIDDLEEYNVFTMEGEYIHGEGNQQITGIYNEDFCFKEEREGVARSKIKNFLLDSRLRSKLDNYRRFRTHELISIRKATLEDVKYSTLKSEDVMTMSLNELAVFSLQENLDVTMSQYSSVEEARIRVRSAFKEGRKSRRVYDSSPKPLPGEVDKNNKKL